MFNPTFILIDGFTDRLFQAGSPFLPTAVPILSASWSWTTRRLWVMPKVTTRTSRRYALAEIGKSNSWGKENDGTQSRNPPVGWMMSEASHESQTCRRARNLLIDGKISRKEYDAILKADKHNQKRAEKRAHKFRQTKSSGKEIVVNVLGKECVVNVENGATWGWVLSEIMRKHQDRVGIALLIGMRDRDQKYMDLGEEVPDSCLGREKAVASKVFAVAIQKTTNMVSGPQA